MKRMLIIHSAQIATPLGKKLKKGKEMSKLQIIEDGAIYIEEDTIKAVGKTEDVVSMVSKQVDLKDCEVINATGKCVLPGFIDSHTHFIFGGYRPDEFMARLGGKDYLEIHKMGGGIQSTVEATRKSSFDTLYELGRERLEEMLYQGVTTVEGKSGYGLDKTTELRQLKVMKALNEKEKIDIVTTYLGGHSIPVEYKDKPMAYIEYMLKEVLPIVKEEELAEFCDVFCEEGVFSIEASKKLLIEAQKLGFKSKIHADEIMSLGGAELAGEIGAISADHLLMASEKGTKALAEKEVVATLLPCTAFCLAKPYAPARKMIDQGCGVALASDLNPGSCFANSVPLIFALAVIYMKMSIEEAITAMTLNGAAALNRAEQIGSIEVGKKADMVLLKYPSYKFLVYNTAANIVSQVIKGGEVVYEN